ncbi:MAG: hypothetical protein ACOZIN_19770 [Myxococcota bacterium]
MNPLRRLFQSTVEHVQQALRPATAPDPRPQARRVEPVVRHRFADTFEAPHAPFSWLLREEYKAKLAAHLEGTSYRAQRANEISQTLLAYWRDGADFSPAAAGPTLQPASPSAARVAWAGQSVVAPNDFVASLDDLPPAPPGPALPGPAPAFNESPNVVINFAELMAAPLKPASPGLLNALQFAALRG